jgi:hypothetical protein
VRQELAGMATRGAKQADQTGSDAA